MAGSGSENLDPGRTRALRSVGDRSAITNGKCQTAGVFFWKKALRRKVGKKVECAQKPDNSERENISRRSIESVSTSRMTFDFLGNIRKRLGIEKLLGRKSRQKIHDVQQLHVQNSNAITETKTEGGKGVVLDDLNVILTTPAERLSRTQYQERRCTDFSHQLLSRVEELIGGTTGPSFSERRDRGLERVSPGPQIDDDSCSEREYGAGSESKAKANLTEELLKLRRYGWYWGPISGDEADAKLISEPDGAFLVRDSSDDRYLLTLSFKSSGKLLHARMEHSGGLFSLCNHGESEGFTSVAALIDHSMNFSQSAVFCYSRPKYPGYPSFPVRLTKPVSRFTRVRSLQYLCRFVIRQNTRLDNIRKLPLPRTIKGYIEEAHF